MENNERIAKRIVSKLKGMESNIESIKCRRCNDEELNRVCYIEDLDDMPVEYQIIELLGEGREYEAKDIASCLTQPERSNLLSFMIDEYAKLVDEHQKALIYYNARIENMNKCWRR